MTWTTALEDLRTQLSDGPTDKLAWKKRVLGTQNGVNKDFKTFEFRRVSNFTTDVYPIGVWVNDAQATVDSDDVATGTFALHVAPANGDRLEATYYTQWFLDDQMTSFLKNAANFTGFGDIFDNIPEGLRPGALKYACADAYQELAVRYARRLSEQTRMEDLPHESLKITIESYRSLADQFRKEASLLRDDYYKRQGRRELPTSASLWGRVPEVKPNK